MEQSIQNPTPKTGGVSNTSYKTLKALSEEDIAKWTEFFGAEHTTFMVDTHNAALLRQLRDNSEDDSDEDDEGSNIANVPTNSPASDKEDAQKVFFGSFDPEDFGLEAVTGVLPAVQPYSEVLTVPSIIRFGDLPTIEEEREEKYANFMDEYERNLHLIGKSLMEEFACIELENKEEVAVAVEPEIVRPFGVNNAGPAKTKKDKSVRPPAKNAVHTDVQCDVFELGGRNTHKKVAKYKLNKKPVLPKEARAALRQKARDYKYSLRDPLRGRLYEYESQMNFNHTVDVSPSVTELVNRVMSSFSAAAEQGFSSASDASNNLFRAASEIATAAKGSVFQGSNLVDAITGALTKCMWMVPLIAAAYFTVTSASKGKHLEFAAGLGAMLSMLLPTELWDMLKSLWPANIKGKVEDSDSDTEEWFDAQSGISIGTLSHLMTLTLTYITSGKGDLLGIAKDFTKSMPSYSRSVSSWKELSSFVISITEDFVNFLRTRFGYDRITLFQAGIKRVDDWCKKVMEVLNASHTGGDIMTPDTVATIIELRNEGKILTEVYRFTPEVSPMLHRYLNSLDEICKVCSAAMHMAKGGRAPPVVLMLTGEPGVGKTYLTKCITSYVLSEIIPRERAEKLNMNFDSEVFQKGKSEYWNGYCGQKAVIIDDFAQNVEVAGMDNDWIDLIRMNSCWAYPLNFADLENKGKNFYVSEFIMATTNIKDIDKCLSVIIEPGAITRRIDFGYVVEVAPEFKKGKHIDIAKVDAYARETGEFPFHAWILKKHTFAMKPDNVTDHSRIYNLKDVMDDVCEKIRRNKQYYESTNDIIANMVRKKYDYESQSSLTQWLFRYREDQTSWWRHFRTQYLGLPVRIDDISLPEDDDHPLDIHGQPIQWTGYRYLWGYQRGVQLEIQGLLDNTMLYLTNPIVQLILTMTGSTLLFMFLRQMSKLVYMWFSGTTTSGHKIKTKRSLMRKKKVPDECLAQALDTFRPEDFEHIEEKGGTYVRVMKFTEDTIKRAYERIVGHKAQSNEPDGPRFVYRKITASRVIESDEATAQADMYGDSIIDVANKNSFQIQVVLDGKKVTVGHILFIRDTFALMPAHFDSEFRRVLADGSLTLDDDIKFVNAAEERLHLNVKVGDFMSYERRSLPEDDITLVKFGPTMRAHRDICDKFIRDSDLKSMRNIRVRLDTHEGTERFIQRSRHMNATRKEQTRVKCDGVPYTLATSFEYLGYTRAGDCGGVVGLEEAVDKQCRRIIGLHTAGIESLGLGLCSILTQEKIAFLLDGRGAIKDTMYDSQAHMELVGTYVEGSFIALNKMERSHCMNPVSSLVRTKLYAKWGGGIKIPAPLKEFVRDGKRINPMKNAVLPYGSAVRTYDQDEVSRAAHHAFSRFRELTKDSERRIYSFEEAVAGIAGTNVNGIPRNTSPGYPYVLDGMTNKKLFFGGGDTYEFTSDACLALKAECQRVLDDAALGIRNPHWFVDFLKDELRAPAKAEAGLTRLISSCPMVYLIAFRQMFLAFTRAVQDTRIRNGVAVGINPYTEWDYLTQQMKSKGPHCVAGDFKGFDSSEQPDIHWAILNQINAWYDDGPRNALIRKVLWLELVHSRHIGGLHGKLNISYQWNKSLPSGHPMTSIVNSFYNLILFNMVWVRSVGIGLANRFWDLVYICTYGDDNILNISPEVVKKFNQFTIEKHMADLGMVYTNENKEGDVANTRPISEISFLKRGFRYEDSVRGYVGPQELDSILYVPYWSKNKSMIDDITLCNVEFTYQELSLHGDEVWNKYAFPIREAVREVYKTEPQHYFDRKEYVRVSQTSTMVWPV